MWTNNFLYLAFIGQVILISFYAPKKILQQTKLISENTHNRSTLNYTRSRLM